MALKIEKAGAPAGATGLRNESLRELLDFPIAKAVGGLQPARRIAGPRYIKAGRAQLRLIGSMIQELALCFAP